MIFRKADSFGYGEKSYNAPVCAITIATYKKMSEKDKNDYIFFSYIVPSGLSVKYVRMEYAVDL